MSDYHFFWSGPLSNWYPSTFKWQDEEFNCVEQYMMFYKALTFGDFGTADEIMLTKNPKEQKALGREVSNFNIDIWNNISYTIVFGGCLAKFKQNKDVRDILIATGDKILVEASPYDRIWGIGYSEENALKVSPDSWGYNRLGKVLMDVRNVLV